jgi:hypothetical protein
VAHSTGLITAGQPHGELTITSRIWRIIAGLPVTGAITKNQEMARTPMSGETRFTSGTSVRIATDTSGSLPNANEDTLTYRDLDEFTRGYIDCALWSSNDESTEQGGEPFDANYGPEDLTSEAIATMAEDCRTFQETYADLLSQADSRFGSSGHGHDFWLTRNGHGAGFWDRGYGVIGDQLSEASKAYGSADLYLGDDERIHIS